MAHGSMQVIDFSRSSEVSFSLFFLPFIVHTLGRFENNVANKRL